MASKPETTLYGYIHKHLPREVYRMKNNNPFVGGIPDCWYSGNVHDLWIEYKWLPRVPQRGVVSPTKLLSDLQAKWLRERHNEGRKVAVVIGCPSGGVALAGLTWEVDIPAKEFVSQVQSRLALADWITGQVHKQ